MIRADTRQRLIEAGLRSFRRSGSALTGLGTVVMVAGVPQGSFYDFMIDWRRRNGKKRLTWLRPTDSRGKATSLLTTPEGRGGA